MAEYASRLSVAKEQINQLSNKVASGFEMRDVECLVEFHEPERNKKRLTRSDTGERWVEPMNDVDFNLFTQFSEGEGSEEEEIEGEEVNVGEVAEDKPKRSRKAA